MAIAVRGPEGEHGGRSSSATAALVHVCGLAQLPRIMASSGARDVVSLINRDMQPPTPQGVEADRHLRLVMNDISAPREGLIAPANEHVMRLVEFITRWDHDGPLVVHCWAGISRSSAAAFITVCALNPTASEVVIAEKVRAASPTATPNPRLVALADQLLGRDGRMVAAIAAIGRGADAIEGVPYWLASRV